MDPIYVCGHRNPDTDSVVSAMAFAALHNALGDNAYVAAMQGAPNDETQFLLDRFGFQAPTLLTNVRTQVRDIDYDRPPTLGTSVPTVSPRSKAISSTTRRIRSIPFPAKS